LLMIRIQVTQALFLISLDSYFIGANSFSSGAGAKCLRGKSRLVG